MRRVTSSTMLKFMAEKLHRPHHFCFVSIFTLFILFIEIITNCWLFLFSFRRMDYFCIMWKFGLGSVTLYNIKLISYKKMLEIRKSFLNFNFDPNKSCLDSIQQCICWNKCHYQLADFFTVVRAVFCKLNGVLVAWSQYCRLIPILKNKNEFS